MIPYSRPNTLSDLYTLSQFKLLETLCNPKIILQYPFGKDLNFCVHGQEGRAKVQLLISKAEEDSSLLSYFENLVHVLEI